jgi:hypothetical protein
MSHTRQKRAFPRKRFVKLSLGVSAETPRFGSPPCGLPDVRSAAERASGAWLNHESPEASVMMQIPGIGAFVRALLVVRLMGSHAVTYGVWVGVDPDDLQRAFRVWREPEYENLRLEGALANSVPPWGLLAAPVTLAVKDPERTPYCVSSSDHLLSRVLGQGMAA